jgi:hypothetical protein
MKRHGQNLIDAIRELDAAFEVWVSSHRNNENELNNKVAMAQALGKVKGLAYIFEQENRPFSSFQHSEHLYGTENSQG